ncbi:hypothetical protein O59_002671 [Cellvibrio sp. BR]|uniref:hypothetical protein n=1 Tax=Cellvibrio sp. BR TaxID=1134474 RepID=UPI000260178F|nr:hypothetical protein [Cellvibrio sp. BR]EIK44569.1 hypothetical protein O59_002671 [Cellvibrio sp. BR]
MKNLLSILLAIPLFTFAVEPEKSAESIDIESNFNPRSESSREEYKPVIEKLANTGDINASFLLGNYYEDKRMEYLTKAAEGGHSKAAGRIIEILFMSSSTFTNKDPSEALRITEKAMTINRELDVYNLKTKIDLMQKCSEADPFDMNRFLNEFKVDAHDSPWKWANIISNEKNDIKLVFQLVCRGGETDAEFEWAVKEFYKHWKSGTNVVFEPCSYAAGKFTMGGCAQGTLYK